MKIESQILGQYCNYGIVHPKFHIPEINWTGLLPPNEFHLDEEMSFEEFQEEIERGISLPTGPGGIFWQVPQV